jgi:hypothetical protein
MRKPMALGGRLIRRASWLSLVPRTIWAWRISAPDASPSLVARALDADERTQLQVVRAGTETTAPSYGAIVSVLAAARARYRVQVRTEDVAAAVAGNGTTRTTPGRLPGGHLSRAVTRTVIGGGVGTTFPQSVASYRPGGSGGMTLRPFCSKQRLPLPSGPAHSRYVESTPIG